ncbi:acyltransferase family protein [Flavobacterium sp. MAHUQ-51]|uniref:acyltransferase family protein n=1 Tax=Flavobacterium sp. GCM10022190 TaxID=3252639 RepID=UPI00360EB206
MRLEQLTFTRFLAAISIVIFHFGKEVFPFYHESINFLVLQANFGVSYFFILSGFIMIISYGNKENIDYLEYIKNRFARIYPLYLIGILAMIIKPLLVLDVNIFDLFYSLIMVQAWIPGKAMLYNFPGWSLSVEMFFYMIFPLVYNYGYRFKRKFKITVVLIFIVWLFSQFVLHYFLHNGFYQSTNIVSHQLLFYFPLMHLNEFLVGNLAGLFFLKNKDKFNKNYDLLIIAIFTLLIFVLKYPIGLNYHNGVLVLLFVPLILLLSFNTGMITTIFKNKFLVFLGEVSYGIYILQLPLFYYSKELYFVNPTITFFMKLLLHISISCLVYLYVEQPMRVKIKSVKFKRNLIFSD